MEEIAKDDLKRGLAVISVLIGIVFIGITIFGPGGGNLITGASAADVSVSLGKSVAALVGLVILAFGAIVLYKLNR